MEHILRGVDSLQREIMKGRMERKRGRGRPRQRADIRGIQEKGTTSRRVESLDIWTGQEAGDMKKIEIVAIVYDCT